MKSRRGIVAVVTVVLGSSALLQGQIDVPADQPTIQDAIDVAQNGDLVLVAPGVYPETIDFLGKEITVRGAGGPSLVTIDGGGMPAVVTFASGEGPDSILEGFTIRDGIRGIRCIASSPMIRNNVLLGNGRGVEVEAVGGQPAASPTIIGNTITQNTGAGVSPGATGIYLSPTGNNAESATTITNNTITLNARGGVGVQIGVTYGGYFQSYTDFLTTIANNAINENSGHGIQLDVTYYNYSRATISNNTVSENAGSGVYATAGDPATDILGDSVVDISRNRVSGNDLNGVSLAYNRTISIVELNEVFDNDGTGLLSRGSLSASHNQVFENGTGVRLFESSSTGGLLLNNTITSNFGTGVLLAKTLYFNTNTPLEFSNNTVAANGGDGLRIDGSMQAFISTLNVSVENSIVWGNATGITIPYPADTNVVVGYTDVQGGYPGPGNIDVDPLFVSGPTGDFFLSQIPAGQAVDSPCVDSGNPLTPLILGTTRTDEVPDTSVIDMGYHQLYRFIRGDCNGSGPGPLSLGDGLTVLDFQFIPGTPSPPCLAACDADGNRIFNGIEDGLHILNFLFAGGPPPAAPFPRCGTDFNGVASLGCDRSTCQ